MLASSLLQRCPRLRSSGLQSLHQMPGMNFQVRKSPNQRAKNGLHSKLQIQQTANKKGGFDAAFSHSDIAR
jgi:hypothetical protein